MSRPSGLSVQTVHGISTSKDREKYVKILLSHTLIDIHILNCVVVGIQIRYGSMSAPNLF